MRQRRANTAGDRLLMILTGLFLYAPIIILIVFSFNAGNSSSEIGRASCRERV